MDNVAVRNIMITDVISVRDTDTLEDAAEKLAEHNVGGAPVIDDAGCLKGIISDGDILTYINTYDSHTGTSCKLDPSKTYKVCLQKFGIFSIEPAEAESVFNAFRKAGTIPVSQVMVREVMTVSPDDDIEKVSSILMTRKIKRIPVVESGRVIGIVSRADIVRYVARRKAAETLLKQTI